MGIKPGRRFSFSSRASLITSTSLPVWFSNALMQCGNLSLFILKTASILLVASLTACQPAPESVDSTDGEKSQVTLRTAHSNWIEEHF